MNRIIFIMDEFLQEVSSSINLISRQLRAELHTTDELIAEEHSGRSELLGDNKQIAKIFDDTGSPILFFVDYLNRPNGAKAAAEVISALVTTHAISARSKSGHEIFQDSDSYQAYYQELTKYDKAISSMISKLAFAYRSSEKLDDDVVTYKGINSQDKKIFDLFVKNYSNAIIWINSTIDDQIKNHDRYIRLSVDRLNNPKATIPALNVFLSTVRMHLCAQLSSDITQNRINISTYENKRDWDNLQALQNKIINSYRDSVLDFIESTERIATTGKRDQGNSSINVDTFIAFHSQGIEQLLNPNTHTTYAIHPLEIISDIPFHCFEITLSNIDGIQERTFGLSSSNGNAAMRLSNPLATSAKTLRARTIHSIAQSLGVIYSTPMTANLPLELVDQRSSFFGQLHHVGTDFLRQAINCEMNYGQSNVYRYPSPLQFGIDTTKTIADNFSIEKPGIEF